jgi:hypothetical protein
MALKRFLMVGAKFALIMIMLSAYGWALNQGDIMEVKQLVFKKTVSGEVLSLPLNKAFESCVFLQVRRAKELFNCSAVKIGPRQFLTAAHCMDDIEEAFVITSKNKSSIHIDEDEKLMVSNFSLHPLYRQDRSNYFHDWASFELTQDTPHIPIATLAKKRDLLTMKSPLLRVGMGDHQPSVRLKKRTLSWIDIGQSSPVDYFIFDKSFSQTHPVILKLNDRETKVGDSGGPVFMISPLTGEPLLLGLHSTREVINEDVFTYSVLLASYSIHQ